MELPGRPRLLKTPLGVISKRDRIFAKAVFGTILDILARCTRTCSGGLRRHLSE